MRSGVARVELKTSTLKDYISMTARLLLLRGEAAKELTADFKSTPRGMFIFAVFGFLAVLLEVDVYTSIICALIVSLLSFPLIWISHGLARLLGGKAGFIEFYRPAAALAVLSWPLAFLPDDFIYGSTYLVVADLLLAGWDCLATMIIFENIHRLSRPRAVALSVITFLVYFALTLLFWLSP